MKPDHTVIYTHGGGRLGNQVLRFLHWIAWVRNHPGEVELVNLSFWPFAEFFAEWREHPGCVFPRRRGAEDWLAKKRAALPRGIRDWSEDRTRLPRVIQAMGKWRPGWQAVGLNIAGEESIDLDEPGFLQRVKLRRVTTCSGWKIASWRLVAAQQKELRNFFRPAPEFARRARGFLAALREKYEVVAGLLIRQSDYRTWYDGRFFYSVERYANWIRQLIELHPGRRLAIVVASEERLDPATFSGLPVFFATGSVNAGGPWFESWVELSLCDFVLSAPSTFSATAAFVGDVPLWPLSSAEQTLSLDQILPDALIAAARHPVFSCAVK